MNRLTVSMQEKSWRRARETSKIVKTIDEIAFQTTYLALMRAVEARARAGESGAGFAGRLPMKSEIWPWRAAEAAKITGGSSESSVGKIPEWNLR